MAALRRCAFALAVLVCAAAAESAEPFVPGALPEIPEGWAIVEGDILVPEEPLGPIGPLGAARQGREWPDGIVPYVFDSNVTSNQNGTQWQANALAAMAAWESAANIDFRPKTAGDDHWIHIQNSSSNSSPVGRQDESEQPQVVNIFNWTMIYRIGHEFGHALGFWHEQSRSTVTYDPRCADPDDCDRNDFVTVNDGTNGTPNNIASTCGNNGDDSCAFNFQMQDDEGYGPYDYDSVMHYGADSFSINPSTPGPPPVPSPSPTLVVAPALIDQPVPFVRAAATPNEDCATDAPDATSDWGGMPFPSGSDPLGIGQRTHLSYWDCKIMSFRYPQTDWRFVSQDRGLSLNGDGSFLDPYDLLGDALGDAFAGSASQIIVDPGTYEVTTGVIDYDVVIEAPVGGVVLVPD